MSTKRKKLYSLEDIEGAKADDRDVKKYFAHKCQRRITRQVRVSEKWHKRLKEVAHSEDMIISFLLDKICKHFFSNYRER